MILNKRALNTAPLHSRHVFKDDEEEPDVTNAFRVTSPTPEPDAERRLIYLADLNREGVLTLADRVSGSQAPALQQAIRDYIFSKPAIECKAGITFSLAFHLPFFAWRRSEEPQIDERRCGGKPLRKCIDVSFLIGSKHGADGSNKKAYIYEAQSSCLVAGIDHWVWDAYGMIDTYFEVEENRKDFKYYEDACKDLPDGTQPDLIPAGEHFTDHPIWTPREYFLMVFESRVTLQLVPEWSELVDQLTEVISNYIRENSQRNQKVPHSSKETESERKSRLKYWTSHAEEVLTRLICVLEDTTECWDQFSNGAVHCFDDVDEEAEAGQYIPSIDRAFCELRRCYKKLKDLQKHCDQFSRAFKLELQVDDNQMVFSQLKDAKKSMAILILTTVLLVPVNLVAAVFNVPSVVPFPVNPANFGIANVITVSSVGAIIILFHFGSVLCQPVAFLWKTIMSGSQEPPLVSTEATNQSNEGDDPPGRLRDNLDRFVRRSPRGDTGDPELGGSKHR